MTGHLFCKRAALALMALFAALAMTLLPADGRNCQPRPDAKFQYVCEQHRADYICLDLHVREHPRCCPAVRHGIKSGGYTLTSIGIILNSTAGGATDLAMTLHSGSANGTKVADFAGPSSLTAGRSTYTLHPDCRAQPGCLHQILDSASGVYYDCSPSRSYSLEQGGYRLSRKMADS